MPPVALCRPESWSRVIQSNSASLAASIDPATILLALAFSPAMWEQNGSDCSTNSFPTSRSSPCSSNQIIRTPNRLCGTRERLHACSDWSAIPLEAQTATDIDTAFASLAQQQILFSP